LATVSARTPSAVFIWDVENGSLSALIICSGRIAQFEWSPAEEILALSTGAAFLGLWSPAGISSLATVESMIAESFQWRSDGNELLLIDRAAGTFVIADKYN
jgi:hypothetical protein